MSSNLFEFLDSLSFDDAIEAIYQALGRIVTRRSTAEFARVLGTVNEGENEHTDRIIQAIETSEGVPLAKLSEEKACGYRRNLSDLIHGRFRKDRGVELEYGLRWPEGVPAAHRFLLTPMAEDILAHIGRNADNPNPHGGSHVLMVSMSTDKAYGPAWQSLIDLGLIEVGGDERLTELGWKVFKELPESKRVRP
jgi:hypothetical protein